MTRTTIVIAAALMLAVTLPIAPTHALVARTFVLVSGGDSCANVATPCRHPRDRLFGVGSLAMRGEFALWARIAH